jgi:hypothetical protein
MGETLIDPLVFLDNTVLSNFALIGCPDLIFSLWSGIACTTRQVMQEYQAGVKISRLPAEAWEDLPVYELTDAEIAKATELPSQLGAGERTCLAAAIQRQGVFASDDQQARKYALQIGLIVIGSIGILVRCVKKGLISKMDAQALLDRMIAENYHSPITNLDEILD